MSIEESGLGRWSRLKKARKDRVAKDHEAAETQVSGDRTGDWKGTRGRAVPTAVPVEVSGDYRPWLPPLTAGESETLPAVSGGDVPEAGENTLDDRLSDEERATAEEMSLPDIDTLEEESDYRGFMNDGVPDKLRRLALRKLWASNPLFGVRDGLNDYDEDFRALSDYVYNTAAMKQFTEPGSVEEEGVAKGAGQDAEEQEVSETESGTGTEQKGAEKTADAEVADESPGDSMGEPGGEISDESEIVDDDPELG